MTKSLATLAREGDIEALFATVNANGGSKNDRDVYKWLCVASDFGHEEAEDRIDDLMEVSSMRYDDDRFEVAAAHWELAVSYLEGGGELPRDLELAKKHLERAFEQHRDLDAINAGTNDAYSASELLERLPDDARRVLEVALAGDDYARAIRHIERVRRLVDVDAPKGIVDDERRLLRQIVGVLCPPPAQDDIERMGAEPLADELAFTEHTFDKLSETLTLLRAESARRVPRG